jgi:outer membrane cobalamin receptor
MKHCSLLALIFLIHFSAFAQKNTLSGYVQDAKTKERLIGATVYISQLKVGTQTNAFGFFSITIPATQANLIVKASYVGYQTDSINFEGNAKQTYTFNLPQVKTIKEIKVKGKKSEPIQESTQMSKIELPISTIKKLPAFLGEVDVLKAIQLLPGVQAGSEGQNGLYVRGGGPDQNLILLDGIPVYNASHLFGFFSVFNADAVNSVEVYKGGFPARYGGRLSSVIDIRMKEGDKSGLHGSLGIGLIASRLLLEGPINKKKEKGSWMISGRRTYIDLITSPLIKAASNGDGLAGYYFYDLNAKANYKLSKRDKIYFSTYTGKDKFYAKGYEDKKEVFDANIKWGNLTALARWNHEYSPKVFGNLSATYSKYQFQVSNALTTYNSQDKSEKFSARYSSNIRDWAAKYDFDIIPNPRHYLKTGASATFHRFVPGAINFKNSVLPSENVDTAFNVEQTPELDAYLEDDIEVSKKLKLNLGIHASSFKTKNNFYLSAQPRVSARFLINKDLSVKASYSNMTQFIHLLTNNGIGLPTDLWVPVTDKIKPQDAKQIALGLAQIFKEDYEISVEGYYKRMENIIEYKDGSSFLNSNQSWEDKVEMGKGWSYGGELFIQKKTGRLTGMMGYTLSWTNRQFPTINNGKLFPYKYDRRHDFKIAGVYRLSKKVELSGEWIYGTGNAISLPEYRYNSGVGNNNPFSGGSDMFYYGERNKYRMRSYHRFDIGINFIKEKKHGRERTWNFSIYNAYSRRNPYFIYQQYNAQTQAYTFKQISIFPILPAFSYNLKF